MEFTFETQGTGTFLTYRLGERDMPDALCVGMLSNNKIAGVAPLLYTQRDEERYLRYNVSARVPVSRLFADTVTKKRLIGVFLGIAEGLLDAREYMLDASGFVLDPDYIFADVTTNETLLICLPLERTAAAAPDLSAFFKGIVFGTRYDQNENNDYVAALISYLNGADAFSLSDFAVLLRQLSGEAPAAPTASAAAPGMPGMPPRAAAPVPAPPANSVNPISPPRAEPKPAAASIPSAPPAISAPPAMSPPPPAAPDTAAPPPRPPIKLPPPTATPVAAPPAKKITLLDLLMHYSKENKAAYDAQRAAAKAGNDTRAAAAAANDTRAPKASEPRPSGGFAVPGERPVMPRESASPTPSAAPTPVQAYQTAPPVNAPPRRAGNFGETVMLGGDDAIPVTSSLGDGAEARSAYLVRSANNERIALTKPVFRIGKERDFADYFIGDNTAVSRSHAEIISRGGEYFVSDMNSTNHTYLDGEMLQGGMETPLRHGAKITLANEEFEFRLR